LQWFYNSRVTSAPFASNFLAEKIAALPEKFAAAATLPH
jgi:hypothetical protein